MAVTVTFNNQTFSIPEDGDKRWGTNVTDYLTAISTGALQKSGGLMELTADLDTGQTFGLKAPYFSASQDPASVPVGSIFSNGGDLYWKTSAGNDLRLTTASGINVAGITSGVINGDYGAPGVPADVSYYLTSGTFYFSNSSNDFAGIRAGELGLGTASAINTLDVGGNAAIGASYAGLVSAPTNGLIVQGNVGFKTTAPNVAIAVEGAGIADNNVPVQLTTLSGNSRWYGANKDTGYGLLVGYDNANFWGSLRQVSTDPLTIIVNNTQRAMTFLSNRNVGIGTVTPAYRFHVEGTATSVARFDGTTGNTFIDVNALTATRQSAIQFLDQGTVKFQFGRQTDNSLFIWDADNARNVLTYTPASNILRLVPSSGKVMIGNSGTPQNTLDVEGAVAIGATYSGTSTAPTNGLIVQGATGIGQSSVTEQLEVTSAAATSNIAMFTKSASGSKGLIRITSPNSTGDGSRAGIQLANNVLRYTIETNAATLDITDEVNARQIFQYVPGNNFINLGTTKIYAAGGYKMPAQQVSFASLANQAAVQCETARIAMPWAGSIIGLSVAVELGETRSAGTFTLNVAKNGSAVSGPSAVINVTNPITVTSTYTQLTYTFAAGDVLHLTYTTDAAWATNGTNGKRVTVILWVEA